MNINNINNLYLLLSQNDRDKDISVVCVSIHMEDRDTPNQTNVWGRTEQRKDFIRKSYWELCSRLHAWSLTLLTFRIFFHEIQ